MRVLIGLLTALIASVHAHAQLRQVKKREEVYMTPRLAKEKVPSEKAWNQMLWDLMHETMPSDEAIRANVVESETGPFYMAKSVSGDATMPLRSRKFGAGEPSYSENRSWTMEDRKRATELPESQYAQKAEDEAIQEAIFRHFFEYRQRGFAPYATTYMLGLGPHAEDAPTGVIERLGQLESLKKEKIEVVPASRALEITEAAIRDRETGAYGVVFRVDRVGLEEDGTVKAIGSFSERDGFWFTREFTLKKGPGGWQVIGERDLAIE